MNIDIIDKHIDIARYPYLVLVFLVHFCYFVAFFGILTIEETYMRYLNVITQTFIVVFLLYRFHPFRTQFVIKPVDLTVVFGSALLLGTNLVSVELSKLRLPNSIKSYA